MHSPISGQKFYYGSQFGPKPLTVWLFYILAFFHKLDRPFRMKMQIVPSFAMPSTILTLRICNEGPPKHKMWPAPPPHTSPSEVEGVRIVVISVRNIAKNINAASFTGNMVF